MGILNHVKDFILSSEMLNLVAEIDDFKGVW